MPSGKRSRADRRRVPPPPVRSKGAPRPRRASRRLLVGAAVVVAAVVVAIALAAVFTGGGSSSNALKNAPAVGSLQGALPGAAEVHRLFAGIPQNGTTLGKPSAPVTLEEWVDVQCPYCREFETQVFPDIVQRFVRPGKVKVVLRPWAFIGSDSVVGQSLVLAAAQQDHAFDLLALLYGQQGVENSGWLTEDLQVKTAASVPGLRVRKLFAERGSHAVDAKVAQVDALAQQKRISGTPTLYAGSSGSQLREVALSSPTDEQTLVAALKRAYAASSSGE